MDAAEELTSKPTVPVCSGASELQADEELDSKLVIMHCGGEPAVRMCFIPPPCAAVVQHCIMLAVKGPENPAPLRQPRSLEGLEVGRIASSRKSLNVTLANSHASFTVK